jgi:hypothetical protein
MNITAKRVQQYSSSSYIIETTVKTILQTFQAEIIEASKNGGTSVRVPVPTNFNVANMSNKTAQTIIYHKLIEELKKNDFEVNIIMKESQVTYCIKWDIDTSDDNDLSSMRKYIASHIKHEE